MPLYIILYLTYQCNLSCRHCLCDDLRNNNLLNPKTGIEVDIIRRIAQEMLLNGVFKIILTGGEPTFYKNFLKALEIFYNNKISISIITNGTLLKDDNLLEEIKKYDDGTLNFNVSLNGDDNGDGFLRGGNAYKETIRGLQNLIKYGYKDRITVKAVYYKNNLKNVELFVKILYKIGIKDIKFIRLQPFGKGREIKELCPDINDIIYVNRKIIELGDKYPDISICGDIRSTNKCAIPFSFAVLPNGDVIPCEVFELRLNEEVIMGNIKNTPIEKVWNSQKSKDIREKSKDFTKVEISCKRCNLFNYCLTNLCFAYNYIVFESRRTISKPCKFYEKFF